MDIFHILLKTEPGPPNIVWLRSADPSKCSNEGPTPKNLVHEHTQVVLFIVVDGNEDHPVFGQHFL